MHADACMLRCSSCLWHPAPSFHAAARHAAEQNSKAQLALPLAITQPTRLLQHRSPTVTRSSSFLEAPKSASLTSPVLSTRMLAPLMSRCITPLLQGHTVQGLDGPGAYVNGMMCVHVSPHLQAVGSCSGQVRPKSAHLCKYSRPSRICLVYTCSIDTLKLSMDWAKTLPVLPALHPMQKLPRNLPVDLQPPTHLDHRLLEAAKFGQQRGNGAARHILQHDVQRIFCLLRALLVAGRVSTRLRHADNTWHITDHCSYGLRSALGQPVARALGS